MTDEHLNATDDVAQAAVDEGEAAVPPQYGVGPFSIREVALTGVWLVAFVVSFFSLSVVRFDSVWTSGLSWVLTIGVPTAAVFLVVLRRLSPDGIRRVGSLGVDQFASVAFSVSALVWLTWVWETVAFAAQSGVWARSWVMWVEFVLMLGGVALTVFAPLIPTLSDDFAHRPEVQAHRNARPLRPVVARPAPALPAFQDEAALTYGQPTAYAAEGDGAERNAADAQAAEATGAVEPFDEYGLAGDQDDWKPAHTRDTYAAVEPEPEPAPVRHQAFWALAPEERDVVDASGRPVFRIGPTAWALVIEDREDSFVVRHEDGRVGYLTDVTGVTRG